jgi:hypothetical protein
LSSLLPTNAQLGRLVDYLIGRVRQRDDRKQDRHDARDRTIRGALASFKPNSACELKTKH